MEKVKVSAVSYLNTRPFLHGLQNSPIANQVDLSLDIPSAVALKLTSREATTGLLPAVVMSPFDPHEVGRNRLRRNEVVALDSCEQAVIHVAFHAIHDISRSNGKDRGSEV